MALKIAGKLEELRKIEERIKKLQEKKKLIELSIRRDEDEEIVKALRSLNLSHEELVRTLGDLRAGKINAGDLKERASTAKGKQDEKPADGGTTENGAEAAAVGK